VQADIARLRSRAKWANWLGIPAFFERRNRKKKLLTVPGPGVEWRPVFRRLDHLGPQELPLHGAGQSRDEAVHKTKVYKTVAVNSNAKIRDGQIKIGDCFPRT